VTRAICNALRLGNYIDVAARFGGITKETFYVWCRLGRKRGARDPHKTFVEEVDRALAQCETQLLGNIRKAGEDDWKAAAWLLERRFRSRWGAIATVNLRRVAEEIANATDEELLAILAGAGPAPDGAPGSPEAGHPAPLDPDDTG
jgi:transposase-like protein